MSFRSQPIVRRMGMTMMGRTVPDGVSSTYQCPPQRIPIVASRSDTATAGSRATKRFRRSFLSARRCFLEKRD